MQTQLYWGKRYKIESKLEIIYDNGEVISITNTNVDGCLRKYDPHYEDLFDCTPEDVDCEEV